MAKSRRTGPLPDREPLRSDAPAPVGRVPPFVLMRSFDGDVLIAPFPRREGGPSPNEAAIARSVACSLARDLPAGCWWVDVRSGSATPAAIAIPQLKRRLLDCASFNLRAAA
jgi:hypothetical protein